MGKLSRLFSPRSVVVIGGGTWCRSVIQQLQRMAYSGEIWRVHPDPSSVEGVAAFTSLAELPAVPDAAFIGVNRAATIETVRQLSVIGAGGAVCFASGFAEALAEDMGSASLQNALIAAAGEMPILGPNCYGFINALDGALLWPDQHGCARVDRGVAILAQSSNIAINLTMQRRGLPISYVITCGNMAQTTQAEIAMALLDDDRVTAIGLHVEGFRDTRAWYALARKAHARGIPLVALKVGVSERAQQATVSHTASLAGSDAGANALLRYLGIARVYDLPTLLETLMLLHCNGPLDSGALSSISCSGGEACLAADAVQGLPVYFPELSTEQKTGLSEALGPMVALSNPLDYHTYVWGDVEKMTAAWLPMAGPDIGLTLIILDYPHTDPTAWEAATQAAIAVRRISGKSVAVVSTLPELLPEDVSVRFLEAGVTPLRCLRSAVAAAAAVQQIKEPQPTPPWFGGSVGQTRLLTETKAKAELASFGVKVPLGVVSDIHSIASDARGLQPPLVLKGEGLAHKSESGAVRLRLVHDDLLAVAQEMPGDRFLVEEMVQTPVAEVLVGVTRDAAHGFLLTLAAGGVLTELWQDRVSLLLPASRQDVAEALARLRIYPVLCGYRGQPAARIDAIVAAVMAVQDYVEAHMNQLQEIEINPLMCTEDNAIAVDALISLLTPEP